METRDPCEFCDSPGGTVLWQDDFCRVVRADEPDYPGFCRVILARHVREMTDLPVRDRGRLMDVVFTVERAVRDAMAPHKMNVASLGNMVPHVHWHVIPRFSDDRHFPGPVWAAPRRDATMDAARIARAEGIAALLRERLPG
ncbi:MAG TPA: HIT family protein [Usitatibacter sp.]|nr:HIT family protein [Usitatibacter sp.]